MSSPRRIFAHIWMIVPICAIGFLVWVNAIRVQRVETLSRLAGGDALVVDSRTSTGYARGVRRLIVPEGVGNSYQWIAETQQMIARGEWRLRHIDYDNAPYGRETRSPSLYRWWLGLLAWSHHIATGQPIGLSVERAAVWADAVLHVLLLASAAGFIGWRFGAWAGAGTALGLAGLYPLVSGFAAGLPNDHGLVLGCIWWSIALLLAAWHEKGPGVGVERQRTLCFFFAGVMGAIGLWANVADQWPILLGIALGGLFAARLEGKPSPTNPAADLTARPWRVWSLGGATATLAAYFLEHYPDRLGHLRVDAIHPLWGVAWIGVGELLARATVWYQPGKQRWRAGGYAAVIFAIAAIVALPVCAAMTGVGRSVVKEGWADQLTPLDGGIVAENSIAWVRRDGASAIAIATFLPLVFIVLAAWRAHRAGVGERAALAVVLSTAVVAQVFAGFQLRWWAALDMTVIALLAVGVSRKGPAWIRWAWISALGVALMPGIARILPVTEALSESDAESLVERDLGQWLANRVTGGEGVVLAPPKLTASIIYHGGLRGLGTPYPDNADGFAAAVRIAGAASADEARALAGRRKVTHIIIPSWDNFLDEYARLAAGHPENTLIDLLHRWLPPRWLRPVAYQVPKIAGFEGRSVVVFEVVELQDNVEALSRLAEYFAEMGQLDQSMAASEALARLFPDEPGALLARAEVAMACGQPKEFSGMVKSLEPRLSEGFAETLPWDRQIGLVVVLAEAKRHDAARTLLRHCLAEIDEDRVRSLTMVSLYRLQLLVKVFGEQIRDPGLRQLARGLLPPEIREGV